MLTTDDHRGYGVVVITPVVMNTAEELPSTGIATDQIAMIAIALMILGGLAVAVTRKKGRGDRGSMVA